MEWEKLRIDEANSDDEHPGNLDASFEAVIFHDVEDRICDMTYLSKIA